MKTINFKFTKIILFACSLFCLGCLSYASPINITSLDGRTISVTVSGIENEEVIITKQDGTTHRLPMAKIDEASKEKIKSEVAKIAARSGSKKDALFQDKEYTKSDIDNAYYASRGFIKKTLNAPSTAKFSNPILDKETTGSIVTNDGRIQSRGVVEAQNSFGVPLQKRWMAIVQPEGPEGKQWRVVYAVLGEDTITDTRNDYKTKKSLTANTFMGMTKAAMIEELGQPIETKTGENEDDGKYTIYTYSKEKGRETLFTIWDSEGKISSGFYQGVILSE